MNKDFFIKQLEDILNDYNRIKSKAQHSEDLSAYATIEEIRDLLTRAKAAIVRIVSDKSEYYKDTVDVLEMPHFWDAEKLRRIIGIITALKSDLQKDYLKSLGEIIQAEVFSDYLDMANHLLNEGYKDPAAVLIGSTLEVHLRELCISNNIDIEVVNIKGVSNPKKADLMNADLAKANVYSSSYQKQIIAWLDLRNKAAHGKYLEYENVEVALMLQGIRQFILITK